MNARFFVVSFAICAVSSVVFAEVQREHYVPCPRGMEGQCGDIPGTIATGSAAGETICSRSTMQNRIESSRAWADRVTRAEANLRQINNAIDGLANTYAPKGKRPPLAELSNYIREDLLAKLVTPTKNQTVDAARCYPQVRMLSDNCYHPHCGDPGVIIRNIENLAPAIDRILADLDRKNDLLLDGLPTSITAGSAPYTYNRCAIQHPQYPCQQAMRKSLNQIRQATEETAKLSTGG